MNATMQLLLPTPPTMSATMRPLLLSLKPRYADLVFEGLKTAELRRRIASHIENSEVFVYVSSPTMELRGGFRVGRVWHGDPEDIWHMVSKFAHVDKQDFDSYFEGLSFAYAFEIKEVWKYREPVSLNVLRDKFSSFVVPQSWRYVRPEEHEFFIKIKSKIKEPDCRVFNLSRSDTSNFMQVECYNECPAVVNPG